MNAMSFFGVDDARQKDCLCGDGRRASILLRDVVALVFVAAGHGSSCDLPVLFLLEKHVGFQHGLALGVGQFAPMLWLEPVPEMKLFHL
jgi:hypothetical protein